jgi:hypothetical protein
LKTTIDLCIEMHKKGVGLLNQHPLLTFDPIPMQAFGRDQASVLVSNFRI